MLTTVPQRIRDLAGRHPLLLDTIFGLMLAVPAAVTALKRGGDPRADVIYAVVGGVALTVRRLWPMPVLAATTAVVVLGTLIGGRPPQALPFALMVCVYTVASRTERHRIWWITAAAAVPFYLAAVLTSSADWWEPQNVGLLAMIFMAAAVGDASGSRRAYVAQIEERARHAEQTREQEARSRVVDERIRIARELHDVVTHHIAVINVQAGAARYVLQDEHPAIGDALDHIRTASGTVLRELASIVGVLRSENHRTTTEPAPGLGRLPALLDSVASAGLHVEHRLIGEVRELPAMVDLAAHRILQEALTNAHKHGTGTAGLTITYRPAELAIEVTNSIGSTLPGGGYGLVGMRERALSAGGTFLAQREPGNRFLLRTVLPVPTKGKP
ncbi:sensor histidine kinase [Actinoplanes subglobosus]|uniref:histidine kinase n=1 Tax=Actinoplanes subglobosus TaxID=1547892 RepID=A0ABV8IKB5_9ACTN